MRWSRHSRRTELDEPLCEGVLPRAVGRDQDFSDLHSLRALQEGVAINRVAITEEVRRRGVLREGVHDLLSRPAGRRVFGHVEVKDASAVLTEDDQHEENAEARSEKG